MKKILPAGLAILMLAGTGAGSMTMAVAADLQSELDGLVKAEKAFSALSVEKGSKDAFIAFLADDGILFRPEPVPGKQWTRDNPPLPDILVWRPVYADVAASADLGYTTGPYEIRKTDTKELAGAGQFMSVWKKQADGTWKVVADIGIPHRRFEPGEPTVDGPDTPIRLSPPADIRQTAAKTGAATDKAALMAMDREFSQASAAKGAVPAYGERLADDVRVLRFAAKPHLGKEAAQAALKAQPGRMTWEPLGGDVSRAGDLGYTYGRYELAPQGKEAEKGMYLRVWKRQAGGPWKLALDITNPPPPPPPPQAPPQPEKPPGNGD
jgi:ketosteroid isomerase-like protein